MVNAYTNLALQLNLFGWVVQHSNIFSTENILILCLSDYLQLCLWGPLYMVLNTPFLNMCAPSLLLEEFQHLHYQRSVWFCLCTIIILWVMFDWTNNSVLQINLFDLLTQFLSSIWTSANTQGYILLLSIAD